MSDAMSMRSGASRGSGRGSGFTAGFAARHDAAAHVLAHAFAPPPGFSPADLRERATPPLPPSQTFADGPKHFSPADRTANPTAGWDLLDPDSEPVPQIDPLATAHAAGYAEGLAAAAAVAQEARERDDALLGGVTAALGSGDRFDRDRVAAQLRQTVLFLVSKLVGEVGIAPDILAGRIETAAELLSDAKEPALLRVHPDDVALLEGRLPATIFAAGDAAVARGSFVLESASTIVEDGPELWLDQLSHAIDRVAVPTC